MRGNKATLSRKNQIYHKKDRVTKAKKSKVGKEKNRVKNISDNEKKTSSKKKARDGRFYEKKGASS